MTIKQVLKKVTKEYLIKVTEEMTKAMGLEDGEANTEDMTKKELLEMVISDGSMITEDDSFCDETWDFLISVGLENAIKFSPVSNKQEALVFPSIGLPEPELDEVIEDSNPPLDDDGLIEEPEETTTVQEPEDSEPEVEEEHVKVMEKKKAKGKKLVTRYHVTGQVLINRPTTVDDFSKAIDDMYVSLNDKPSNMKESRYFSTVILKILEGAQMATINDGHIEYSI